MIQPPPELYMSFCKEITTNFGEIYDTKYMLNSSTLLAGQLVNQKSDLFSAYSAFKARYSNIEPLIEIMKWEDNSEEFEIKSHDAMSDSYMTGFVFLKCLTLLSDLFDFSINFSFEFFISFRYFKGFSQ